MADLDEALRRSAVDAVVVASPTDWHASQVLTAIRHGKHLLCEIPLSADLGEIRRCKNAAAAAGVTLMVCHRRRFSAAVLELQSRIRSGSIHPRQVVAVRAFHRIDNSGWTGKRRDWVDDALWHHGAHRFDTVLALLGNNCVLVSGALALDPAHGKSISAAATLSTDTGAVAQILVTYESRIAIDWVLVIADEETYIIEHSQLRDSKGGIVTDTDDMALQRQDAAFLNQIADESSRLVPQEQSLHVYELLAELEKLPYSDRAWNPSIIDHSSALYKSRSVPK